MTITQACGYITSKARKAIVQATIDQTGKRQVLDGIINELRRANDHALLDKIRADKKMNPSETQDCLEEAIRDIAIRRLYDSDFALRKEVNFNLR